MITAALMLYGFGIVPTLVYLMAIMSDIPREELPAGHLILAAWLVVLMSLAWPVFWAWLLIDMWRE